MMSSDKANQILPRLWLGNFESSQDIGFLCQNQINVIINCSKDLPFLKINDVYKYRVPVHDNLQPEEIQLMTQWLYKIVPLIDSHYKQGRHILVHCAAGMQRSAIIVASYLCKYHFKDPRIAIKHIKSRRPIVFTPAMNFKRSLCHYLKSSNEIANNKFKF